MGERKRRGLGVTNLSINTGHMHGMCWIGINTQ